MATSHLITLSAPRQHIRRNRQAELLRRFQVYDEFELLRLLHREIGGVSAFQNIVDIRSPAPVQVGQTHAVAHKPAGFHKIRTPIYRREAALYPQGWHF